MSAPWQRFAERFDGLAQRERRLVAAAVLGGIVMIGVNGFIEPALLRASASEQAAAQARAQISAMQLQIAELQSPTSDPEVAARAELAAINQQLEAHSGKLRELGASLVSPQRMPALLEEMIGRKSGLRLLSMRNLPAVPMLGNVRDDKTPAEAKGAASAQPSQGLFKHGIEIRLEGSYAELTAYLARLEQMPLKVLWDQVTLSAAHYPKLELTLTVYTLSLDRAWLIV